jgi:N-acetylglutamate synthase-like GNAT family acetyltransferase
VEGMVALIRRANIGDLDSIRAFLAKAKLGMDGLTEETIDHFLLIEQVDGTLTGTLGMEVFAEFGLLRSLVVTTGQAKQDIIILFNQMLKLAKEKGIKSIFMATNKSVTLPFFDLLGFRKITREELPPAFYHSEYMQHVLNVDNSSFFKISL